MSECFEATIHFTPNSGEFPEWFVKQRTLTQKICYDTISLKLKTDDVTGQFTTHLPVIHECLVYVCKLMIWDQKVRNDHVTEDRLATY